MADPKKQQMIPYDAMARAHYNEAIQTRVFDADLVLFVNEYCPDSFHKEATEINICVRPYDRPDDGRPALIVNYDDDGSGAADLARMKAPSTENGEGSSRYAMGHTKVICRMDNNTFRFKKYAKKKGKAACSVYLEGPYEATGLSIPEEMPEVGDARIHRFTEKEQHGYSEEFSCLWERLHRVFTEGRPDPTKKLKKNDIAPPAPREGDQHSMVNLFDHMEEIARVRFPPAFHAQTTINLQEKTKDGLGVVSQRTVRKTTLIDLLRTSPDVQRWEPIPVDMGVYTAVVEMFKLGRDKYSPDPKDAEIATGFPHYKNGRFALIALEGWVVADMPINELYGLKDHPVSQSDFVAYVNLERKDKTNKSDLDKMPIPATVKIGFSGVEYETFKAKVRLTRPSGFIAEKKRVKKSTSAADDDDAKTTATSASIESSGTLPPLPSLSICGGGAGSGGDYQEVQVPTLPATATADMPLELPAWISKMIGTPSNLTSSHVVATGVYTFTYRRAIHDIDRDTIGLALAINEFRSRNTVPIANIDIVWHIAASNEHRIREKVLSHAEDHAVLQCVRFETRA